MTKLRFNLDEIGEWSVLKLDIVEKYGQAYTTAFSKRGAQLKKFYIDGFSGAGVHLIKKTRAQIEGSPAPRAWCQTAFRRVPLHRPGPGQS
jgi:three-Cys-motif partner protein